MTLLQKTALCLFIFSYTNGFSQTDSSKPKELKEVIIRAWQRTDVSRLPDEQNGFLFTGKKNEVITLEGTNANVALKTPRQLFAKIPGVFVYDMDGSGNQINISTRGLDPHRSWEFNIRQNGIITNSDMYGYPASHYSAPAESYEKIELVRGAGALQYGAEFGGMINYVTKRPDSTKPFSFESINTAGSYGLVSSYNAVGGTYKKFSYYAYYSRRHSDGYRRNSGSEANSQFVQLNYQFNSRLSLKAELGRSTYRYHIPGPLNDSLFTADPRTSTRSRNYFSPDIYVPSLTLNWQSFSGKTKLILTTSGVFGSRSSVQLDALATVLDTINRATGQYRNRQVDIDNFHSRTATLQVLHHYNISKLQSTLTGGVQYMNNDLHRRQLGKGTTGTDYDLTLVDGTFGRDLHFKTGNIAVYAENAFQLTKNWTVSPGIRYENGDSKMSGTISYYTVNPLPTTINHHFVLAGISSQFLLNKENTVYGGISQAYRPVVFKDIIPTSTYEQINKDLKDAYGYNAELGIRGKVADHLQYDINLFTLLYNNRLGILVEKDENGATYIYRTNIGNSRTNGVESFIQYKFPVTAHLFAGLFTSTSYMHARYIQGEVASAGVNKSIVGNKVEAVPDWITRNGLDILYKGFSATILYSYTSSTFSDAVNTVLPPASGATGFNPGYDLWDINTSLHTNRFLSVRAGINNIFNKQYFTKRPTFYPGPGIWPGDGRNVYVTLGVKL